jgi:acetate kinase
VKEEATIEAVMARFPQLPQVACFDTAFHRRMPELAQRFSLPRAFWDEGVRRYGFHGLSYEYIIEQVGSEVPGTCHHRASGKRRQYGGGAQRPTARYHDGIHTDWGGVMMGTRTGDLDPGLLLYLLTERGYDATALKQLVNDQPGLLGVSGISPDMRTLLEQRAQNAHAAQAIDMFCYQLCKTIGALTAVLGGLDTLVFTGGIGEHACGGYNTGSSI